jgi:pimeloyl-ACP methyl ester carboxylesterase
MTHTMKRRIRWFLATLGLVLAILAALPWLRSEEGRDLDDTARAAAPGRFITLRQGQVHYRIEGPANGEPVVLVHGFSVPSYVYDGTREALAAAGFRVLSFDLYGRGFSDRPDVVYDRDLFADQLDELMTRLAMPRANIVGLSMGGAVVGRFTARHPERVQRLVLMAPLTQAQDISVLATPGLGDWVFGAYWLPHLRDSQLEGFKHPEQFPTWEARFAEQMQYRGFGRALLSTGRNLTTQPSLPDFEIVGRRHLPVLLVWGRDDQTLPFTDSAAVMKAIPEARLLAVDGVGHLPNLEAPQVVNPAIVAFLRGTPASP